MVHTYSLTERRVIANGFGHGPLIAGTSFAFRRLLYAFNYVSKKNLKDCMQHREGGIAV